MNLVELDADRARGRVRAVRDALEAAGARVERVELVGLVPAAELARCGDGVPRVERASSPTETIEATGRPRRRGRSRRHAGRGPGAAGPDATAAHGRTRRRSVRRTPSGGSPGERPLAAHPAALPLGQPAPDPELLAVGERVLEAVDPHLAAPAHRLGLPRGGAPLGEEQVGIDPQAVGPLLPALVADLARVHLRHDHLPHVQPLP